MSLVLISSSSVFTSHSLLLLDQPHHCSVSHFISQQSCYSPLKLRQFILPMGPFYFLDFCGYSILYTQIWKILSHKFQTRENVYLSFKILSSSLKIVFLRPSIYLQILWYYFFLYSLIVLIVSVNFIFIIYPLVEGKFSLFHFLAIINRYVHLLVGCWVIWEYDKEIVYLSHIISCCIQNLLCISNCLKDENIKKSSNTTNNEYSK